MHYQFGKFSCNLFKKKMEWKKIKSSSAFSGKGFKFDEAEAQLTNEKKKFQKAALGLQDSDDEVAEADIDQEIKTLLAPKKRVQEMTILPTGAAALAGGIACAEKLELTKKFSCISLQRNIGAEAQQAAEAVLKGHLGTTPVITPALQAKNLAEQRAEKLHAKLNYQPKADEEDKEDDPAVETFREYVEVLEINDFPQQARWKFTSKASDAKTRLMRNLKMIKTTNYSMRFCSLLIEAQKINDYRPQKKRLCSSRDVYAVCSSKENLILKSIKEILNLESAGGLVKVILKALEVPEEARCFAKQQIVTMLNTFEYNHEYLIQLIEVVESYAANFPSDIKRKKYENNLILLENFILNYGRYKVSEFLSDMFLLGVYHYDFSLEEKEEIGDLVIQSMPSIEKFVEELHYDFDCEVDYVNLQQRSSLQFIRDLLADCSAQQDALQAFISKLDVVMNTQDKVAVWSLYANSYEPSEDEYSRLSAISKELHERLKELNYAGACDVPKEHTWWQVCKKSLFRLCL